MVCEGDRSRILQLHRRVVKHIIYRSERFVVSKQGNVCGLAGVGFVCSYIPPLPLPMMKWLPTYAFLLRSR